MEVFSGNATVDLILVAVAVAAAVSGWRHGAISSALQTICVTAGLILAVIIAPRLMGFVDASLLRWLIALSLSLMLTGVASVAASHLGAFARGRLRRRSSRLVDSAAGVVINPLGVIFIVYLVVLPLAGVLNGPVTQAVRDSSILAAVHRSVPAPVTGSSDTFASLLSDSGLRPAANPFELARLDELPPLTDIAVDTRLVDTVRPSVVQVIGIAEQCTHSSRGSGFVIDNDLVVTNAHVVAGASRVGVDTVAGAKQGSVVFYDPDQDIAVIRVDGLGLPALSWAAHNAAWTEEVLVVGFPDGGPFAATPGRVMDLRLTGGYDLYGEHQIRRQIYTIDGTVRRGNSGGPMIDANGDVLGVVFADEINNDHSGFVLAAAEVKQRIGDTAALRDPVSTRQCL
ncbi:MarP family serine protease [Corynebacterium mendelii]|uniref:MarP family serine protease n=1 Tax=Corynebacterium mendelii TaxID=2765362 RepID=A0A939DYV9_9CORY|nr:MarP family serine protease [Corynebacterium mendelii]